MAKKTAKRGAGEALVLCIDDSDLARDLISRIVELRDNTRLVLAGTGAEGMQLAVDEPPSLILLDASLPDSDAPKMVQQLRDNPATADVPIAIVSGWRPESVGLNDPAITHIMKPFAVDDLLALFDRVLGPA